MTETVTIDEVEVYGPSAGEGKLGQCVAFDADAVADPDRPVIEVCGEFLEYVLFLLYGSK